MAKTGNLASGCIERKTGYTQTYYVGPETLHHRPLDLGEHLIDVVDPRGRAKAEPLLELVVRRRGDARLPRAAEVDRHAVRLLMVDGTDNTLAGVHRGK